MKKEVCPICWRSNCRLFIRLSNLKFDLPEKAKFFAAFHRDVCHNCHKLSCYDCDDKRKFNDKKFYLPEWWLEAQHN